MRNNLSNCKHKFKEVVFNIKVEIPANLFDYGSSIEKKVSLDPKLYTCEICGFVTTKVKKDKIKIEISERE